MERPNKYKIVKPTFEKISSFCKSKEGIISSKTQFDNINIKIWFDKDAFKFKCDLPLNVPQNQLLQDFVYVLDSENVILNEIGYTFLNDSLTEVKIDWENQLIEGIISSFIQGSTESFNNKYLRFLIPIEKHNNVSPIEGYSDLNTDQGSKYLYATGYNELNFGGFRLEKCRVSNNDTTYQMIDSVDKTNLSDFG